jgi:cardiolipin synthase
MSPSAWLLAHDIAAWVARLVMLALVLHRRLPPSTALAWLAIVFFQPWVGIGLYALLGAPRLGRRRVQLRRRIIRRLEHQRPHWAQAAPPFPPQHPATDPDPALDAVRLQAQRVGGLTVQGGHEVRIVADYEAFNAGLIADIDAAQRHVHLLYYIFQPDHTGGRIAQALIRAAGRGLGVRLLADDVGSRALFLEEELLARLRDAGVEVRPALPVSPWRRGLARIDLRNHRKLAVIDGQVAWTGSQNIVDGGLSTRRGGAWHDLSARVRGPAVAQMQRVFAEDWACEDDTPDDTPTDTPELAPNDAPDDPRTQSPDGARHANPQGFPHHPTSSAPHAQPPMLPSLTTEPADDWFPHIPPAGEVEVQAVPTGPSHPADAFPRVLLAAVQHARSRVLITTPYFVPDEPTLTALEMAAERGVAVDLCLPLRSDHALVDFAARASFEGLLASGVRVHRYTQGVLHSKIMTVDDRFALLGSSNIDIRSFYINLELNILLYGRGVTQQLREVQARYLRDAQPLTLDIWRARPRWARLAEGAASLLSPLL